MGKVSYICHLCGFTPPEEAKVHRCPHDGSYLISKREHAKSPQDAYLGRVLGEKYPILGILGLGGMGAVYRSQQMAVRRHVAIKVIAPIDNDPSRAEELKARFMREARVIAELDHPKVVTLHDFGVQPDGTLYMVMEYVDGKPLSFVSKQLSLKTLVALIIQLLEVLEVAHERGLVHRDIKPDNIMVLNKEEASPGVPGLKLLDFGIAKRVSGADSNRLTNEGTRLGTPHYMSPEQARGLVDVDGRSDLYSTGVILYKALAGSVPFTDTDPVQLIIKVAGVAHPPLPDDPNVPPTLKAIVERALSKDPEDRFSTAAAMREALEAIDWEDGDTQLADVIHDEEPELEPTVMTGVGGQDGPTLHTPAMVPLPDVGASVSESTASVQAASSASRRRLWVAIGIGVAVGVGVAVGWMGM